MINLSDRRIINTTDTEMVIGKQNGGVHDVGRNLVKHAHIDGVNLVVLRTLHHIVKAEVMRVLY